MMGMRMRRVKPATEEEEEEDAASSSVEPRPSTYTKLTSKLPSWSFLPLLCLATALVLLAIMLPVYMSFAKVNEAQDLPLFWPLGADSSSMGQADEFNVELDLVDVDPDAREAVFLFDLSPGGVYEHDDEDGVLELGDQILAVKLGSQSLLYKTGDGISDVNVRFIMEDVSPIFQYPFDVYKVSMVIRITLVNDTDVENRQATALPVGVKLHMGKQGWETETAMAELRSKQGALVPGVLVTATFRRSTAVAFFSMFVVTLMWCISLAMFVIALNYVFSDSLELAYDVPSLCIGLLFALPFVRGVQPYVPTVGISIDILGFFFNIILIALSTVLTMAALSSRHWRTLQADAAKVARRQEAKAQQLACKAVPGIPTEPAHHHPVGHGGRVLPVMDASLQLT